jgi:hypothetical protein
MPFCSTQGLSQWASGYRACQWTQGFAGSNPAEDDGFFKGDKIRSRTSFGEEVMPLTSCRRILRLVEDPCGVWQKYFAC